ncbi:threonine aldolase family protein [Aliiruegeria sabulilitoris]|uniref:threonine aldolase family protein n=1 Tax=Aliiruegeria sabulilitoris TaxID=1510458 RepID=UPI0008299E2E|nr:beta-eliminating lyase-related protein [Aliiruegeria sabulilitoris]NDR59664.1 low specificity L-threonine aldolase [Pseudoruegeria sp. M32A2M]
MHYASDNTGPVHPKVMEALLRANEGYAPAYGAEALARDVTNQIREIFEAPDAVVHLVATGTAANSLLLASHTAPWDTIFCSQVSHVHEDECNAPEFFTGGAKLTLVPTEDGKMSPDALRAAIEAEETRGVHGPQRGPVSLTQATEKGTVHTLEELSALTAIAQEFGLKTHMDGARFANALSTLGCSPAEMTWKSGIDMLSFGGTKNGLMGVEAAIVFDPARDMEFQLRRKRGAHLFSKHRYLAAQMQAYLTDDLWLDMAAAANAACQKLADGVREAPGANLMYRPEANILFARLPRGTHKRLFAAGAEYHLWNGTLDDGPDDERVAARFVTDWSADPANTETFLSLL